MRNIRSVIKKVLKEETTLKDTLEFFKNAPKVDMDEKGRPDMKSLDDFMWYLIDYVDYPNNPDYKKIKEFILGLWRYGMLEKEVALRMKGWLGMKQNALSDKWLDKDIKDVGGDDSFHDWMSQIISMGKDHYEAALDVDKNYKKYSNTPYVESFAYAIPHYSEIEIPEIFR
jgi:hypothetical protein